MTTSNIAKLLLVWSSLFFTASVFADEVNCGALENPFGPFDYRDPTNKEALHLVNIGHFTADVRSLKKGASSYLPIHDLDYALRAFPNHWGALDAISRYELQGGKFLEFRTVDCYFDRAIRFVPDDGKVRLLYGIYLMRRKRMDEARDSFQEAEKLLPDSIDVAYNLGLLYLKLGDLDHAMAKARFAYANGYPLDGLRKELEKAGAWKE
jgi:tetratricopeptide (TPR) repeat protein